MKFFKAVDIFHSKMPRYLMRAKAFEKANYNL
jgi:hypothetical protein